MTFAGLGMWNPIYMLEYLAMWLNDAYDRKRRRRWPLPPRFIHWRVYSGTAGEAAHQAWRSYGISHVTYLITEIKDARGQVDHLACSSFVPWRQHGFARDNMAKLERGEPLPPAWGVKARHKTVMTETLDEAFGRATGHDLSVKPRAERRSGRPAQRSTVRRKPTQRKPPLWRRFLDA